MGIGNCQQLMTHGEDSMALARSSRSSPSWRCFLRFSAQIRRLALFRCLDHVTFQFWPPLATWTGADPLTNQSRPAKRDPGREDCSAIRCTVVRQEDQIATRTETHLCLPVFPRFLENTHHVPAIDKPQTALYTATASMP